MTTATSQPNCCTFTTVIDHGRNRNRAFDHFTGAMLRTLTGDIAPNDLKGGLRTHILHDKTNYTIMLQDFNKCTRRTTSSITFRDWLVRYVARLLDQTSSSIHTQFVLNLNK